MSLESNSGLIAAAKLHRFPRRAIRARQEFGGCAVVEDLLLRHIPFDLSSHHHGDEPEVSGKRRVMRDLYGGNGRFARLDAIEKVALMTVGLVELDLAHVFRERLGLGPCGI